MLKYKIKIIKIKKLAGDLIVWLYERKNKTK